MKSLTHPAVALRGAPRPDVTYDEWCTIVTRLTALIEDEGDTLARRRLVAQRMDALAARDTAWIDRERSLAGLLK